MNKLEAIQKLRSWKNKLEDCVRFDGRSGCIRSIQKTIDYILLYKTSERLIDLLVKERKHDYDFAINEADKKRKEKEAEKKEKRKSKKK